MRAAYAFVGELKIQSLNNRKTGAAVPCFSNSRDSREIYTLRSQHRGQWESDLLFRNTVFVFNLRSTNVYIYLFRMLDKVRDVCIVSPVLVSHNSELVRNSASTFVWHI